MWPTCFGYATSTNLFTAFGEPDIEINKTRDAYVVNPEGIDVYDPTTGEVRSNDTGQITDPGELGRGPA
jgi:hypothetical protein